MFMIKTKLRKIAVRGMAAPVNILLGTLGMLGTLGTKVRADYEKQILQDIEGKSDCFCTIRRRPRTADMVMFNETGTDINTSSAIIMQGPLVLEDDFTLETVRFYQALCPGVRIIVSTWDDADEKLVSRLNQEKDCLVVQRSYPGHSGLLNLNYQVVTTMAGLKKAREIGAEYVFKTRTDYRFYKKGLMAYLYSLLQVFPLTAEDAVQRYRIVAGGETMDSMFRPYWLADQFNYGYIEDMLTYWNHALDDFDMNKESNARLLRQKHLSWKERTDERLAVEPEIVLDYLRRIGVNDTDNTVRRYWELLRDRFIVVSRQDLEFYWHKYFYKYDESYADGTYYDFDTLEKLLSYNWDFGRWLALYAGNLPYHDKYEEYAANNRY